MDLGISGLAAHVVGADHGVGPACAAVLAAEGATLTDTPEGCDIVVAHGDVTGGPRSAVTADSLADLRNGWDAVVHAVAAYREALPTMVENGWGRFVWVGSALAKSVNADDDEVDAVATLAMMGLHKVITGEESPNNVTANTVLRGGDADDDDIAATVAFLCSRGAGYLSGVTITVDGGTGSAVF